MNRIWTMIPYCHRDEPAKPVGTVGQGNDLGHAYNRCMALIPEGDWACFIDHDVFFTTKVWFRQIEEAIQQQPDAGMFCAFTNRLSASKSQWQMIGDPTEEDVKALRVYGGKIERRFGARLREVTTDKQRKGLQPNSGFFMVISKATWTLIGGAPHGKGQVDYAIHRAIEKAGKKIYLIEGLFLYHWFRPDIFPMREYGKITF